MANVIAHFVYGTVTALAVDRENPVAHEDSAALIGRLDNIAAELVHAP
jgi:hypothetical protein